MPSSPHREGDKHYSNGEKALKPSVLQLRFSADHQAAAIEFRQAASCYQTSCQYAKAVEALVRLANVREHLFEYFEAGRCHEEAAMVAERELQDTGRSFTNMNQALELFQKCGKIEAAVRVSSRLAEIHQNSGNVDLCLTELERSLNLYRSEPTEKWHQISGVYKELVKVSAQYRKLDKCLAYLEEHNEVLRKINQHASANKNHLAAVAIYLDRGDAVAAEQAISHGAATESQFLGSNEFATASDAVDAYKAFDAEEFKAVMQRQTWTFMNTELANLARSIAPPCYGGSSYSEPPSARNDAADWMM